MSKQDYTLSKQLLPQDELGKMYGDYQISSLNKWRKNSRTYVEVRCKHTEDLVLLDNLRREQQIGCLYCYRDRNNLPDLSDPETSNLYYRFKSIVLRCTNEKTNGYHTYKDVHIHQEWIDSPLLFVDYVKQLPDFNIGLSLDRIDGARGYEPDNLRWATPKQQAHNRRDNVRVIWNNKEMVFSEFAGNYTKLSVNHARDLYHKGWTLQQLHEHEPLPRGNRVRYPKRRTSS